MEHSGELIDEGLPRSLLEEGMLYQVGLQAVTLAWRVTVGPEVHSR